MDKNGKPLKKKHHQEPAVATQGWAAPPQNAVAPKERVVDRKPVGRGASRGR